MGIKESGDELESFKVEALERFVIGRNERWDGKNESDCGQHDNGDSNRERPEQILARFFCRFVNRINLLFNRGKSFFRHY